MSFIENVKNTIKANAPAVKQKAVVIGGSVAGMVIAGAVSGLVQHKAIKTGGIALYIVKEEPVEVVQTTAEVA